MGDGKIGTDHGFSAKHKRETNKTKRPVELRKPANDSAATITLHQIGLHPWSSGNHCTENVGANVEMSGKCQKQVWEVSETVI